jgi:hypothetical protein
MKLSQYSVWLRTGRPGFDPRQRQRIFPLASAASASRPALGPTQPSVQLVPGIHSPGGKARPGRGADHSPHLEPRLRMSRSYTSFSPGASMACSGTPFLRGLWIEFGGSRWRPCSSETLLSNYKTAVICVAPTYICIWTQLKSLWRKIYKTARRWLSSGLMRRVVW